MNTRNLPDAPWRNHNTPEGARFVLRHFGWQQLNGKHGSWFHVDKPAAMREIQQNISTGLWDVVETTIE